MILGSCAVPKPRARGFASGLHHPLTLALTLRALFAGRKGKCLEKLPPVAAALERQKHSQTIERAFRAWLIDTLAPTIKEFSDTHHAEVLRSKFEDTDYLATICHEIGTPLTAKFMRKQLLISRLTPLYRISKTR